ncbi:MAG: CGNR zinc finger domain-containing protein [Anaerolineae bacterium]|nr:MAG: CGNR zinc finger domain-containing protein [Anaerolineae bacterium]
MSHYSEQLIQFVVDFANTYDPFLDEPEFLRTPADLQKFLEQRHIEMSEPLTEMEFLKIRRLRDRLRDIFLRLETSEPSEIVGAINGLLGATPVNLQASISEGELIEIKYEIPTNVVLVERLAVEVGLGLTLALQQYGPERLKVCAAAPCQEVFIDVSKNKSRRFCGERCANRYNVAHFRERQRPDKG